MGFDTVFQTNKMVMECNTTSCTFIVRLASCAPTLTLQNSNTTLQCRSTQPPPAITQRTVMEANLQFELFLCLSRLARVV